MSPLKSIAVLTVSGAALVAGGFMLRLGGFSVVLAVLGFALLISVPVLLVARLFPSFNRVEWPSDDSPTRRKAMVAAYAQAGHRVRRSFAHGETIVGEHAGAAFEHYVTPGSKRRPPRATLRITSAAPGEFRVHPESGLTTTAKAFGMVDEFRAGDERLDMKYFFSGTSDEYVRQVFGVRENLQALRALLAQGFDTVEKTGSVLAVSRDGGLLHVTQTRAALEQLTKLRLPAVVEGLQGKTLPGRKPLHIVRASAALIGVAGFTGFTVTSPMLDGWPSLIGRTLPLVAVLCAALSVAAYLLLRGRSMSVIGMAELIAYLPLLAIALFGVLAFANQQLDASAAVEQRAALTDRYTTKGRRGRLSFHLEFASWRGRGSENIPVSEEVYFLARKGDLWRLRVRAGWLGCPWIESMRPAGP